MPDRLTRDDRDRGRSATDWPPGLTPAEVRSRRVGLGLTQAELAEVLGVSANTVARWERGEQHIRQARRVARTLARQETRTAPPPRRQAGVPHRLDLSVRLPRELNAFIGRKTDRLTVARLLNRARLLTLTGTGGVGKTRLAVQVARAAAHRYADGVWFVELAGLADPALVPQAVASSMGVREESGRAMTATLADAVGNQQALLVLDNCEHLLHACAELTRVILRTCPRLSILGTSREPLRVEGEVTWRVPPLDTPEHGDRSTLHQAESVQLLMERINTGATNLSIDNNGCHMRGRPSKVGSSPAWTTLVGT